jgi:hypothetical protein
MKGQTAVEYLMIILIVAGVLAYYGIFDSKGFFLNNTNYSSETKAFNVSEHLRCDFYLEYYGDKIVNVTRTDCIVLP